MLYDTSIGFDVQIMNAYFRGAQSMHLLNLLQYSHSEQYLNFSFFLHFSGAELGPVTYDGEFLAQCLPAAGQCGEY